jgi:hypothetical protein
MRKSLLRSLATAIFALAPVAAGAVDLAPHQAVYTLKLGQPRARSDVVGARGAMTLRFEKACEGWTIDQQMVMQIETGSGAALAQNWRFTSWETLDGTDYAFQGRRRVNDAPQPEIRGRARIGETGGEATFIKPEPKTFKLPAGTLLPVVHTALLIQRAQAGERQAQALVFDGADVRGAQEVVAFIGPRLEAPESSPTVLGPLVRRPGWSMRIAYFPPEEGNAVPDYEVQILRLDNGVSPRMVVDYRDFTVVMDLERIEALPAPKC